MSGDVTTARPKDGQQVSSLVSWMKRRGIRDQILSAADRAHALTPPGIMRIVLESRRGNFVKAFDALEEGTKAEIFEAIEAAFHIGKHDALTGSVKGIPVAKAAIMRADRDKQPRSPKIVEAIKFTRKAMEANGALANSGLSYARLILPDVVKRLGRKVSENQVRNYVREILTK